MRIAVIGAGVSGLGAAYALKERHEVTLFEKERRLGGHANTLAIDYDGARIAVDTGFIVYNKRNYPNLAALFEHLGVPSFVSDMSFAVSDPDGWEWSSNGLSGLFAWKRNMADAGFLCLLGDIVKFSAQARADLKLDRINGVTLEDYVAGLRLSRGFLSQYLLPMGAAIWSTPEQDMLRYPATSFLRFFENHRLLHLIRPFWRSVEGGSRTYVEALRHALGPRVQTGDAVVSVARVASGVELRRASGDVQMFDHAVLACHADEAHAILKGYDAEHAALSAIRYAPNTAYLHRDAALMPRRKAAWASWNYLRSRDNPGRVCVTYWMNKLQRIRRDRPLFVTLNPAAAPAPELTFARLVYDHPQFDAPALAAQAQIARLQGRDRIWFAGAWTGHGFHEDGLASGLAVAARLGAPAPWSKAPAPPQPAPALEPARAAA
ncbi:MAG: FAD-dependent oxidoreductase [Hydrogenophilaceae bacterium]|jgi:predicted NAD/FAD-binding protein|nr:FAD-dependent oxidoreductase [Hydrogenophilaceae bacterium]